MENKRFCSPAFANAMFCILVLISLFFVSCSKQTSYPEAARTAADVEIDIKTLKPEIPVFFTYRYQEKNINYFAVRINDKTLSYLDACAKCYALKRGYRFENGYVVCKACNIRYSISEIEKGLGSCFPIRLSGRIQGGKYLIPISELKKGYNRF